MNQEKQDDIQEDTTSMDEKIEALNGRERFEQLKLRLAEIEINKKDAVNTYKSELREKILSLPTYGKYLIKEDVFKLIDEV